MKKQEESAAIATLVKAKEEYGKGGRLYVQLDHVVDHAHERHERPRHAVHEHEAQLDDRPLVVVVQLELLSVTVVSHTQTQ